MSKKIISPNKLAKVLFKLKNNGKKIVYCHGVYDLLHLGHFEHFKKAKEFGDILVVSITPDEFVKKGPNQPFFTTEQRLIALSHIESIDYVFKTNDYDAVDAIKLIKPNYYCKGEDYNNKKNDLTKKINKEIDAVKSIKGKIVITKEINFSSSKILNENNLILNENQKLVVNKIKEKYNFESIQKIINTFKDLKVLIIGETIIDEYVFCEAVGKSAKDPMLVLNQLKIEKYLGGAAAVANHISSFVKNIKFFTIVGEKKENIDFIKNKLKKNIKTKFFYKKGSPTIIKRRFVESITKHKVLGVYKLNNDIMDKNSSSKISKILKAEINKFDLVLVYDYGHGFINKDMAEIICKKSKFLSLNAQINSTTIGHHTIEKYKNTNCIIINESELRHELRDKSSKIEILIKRLNKKINFNECVVTQGVHGATMYSKKLNCFFKCPAFASKIIDKIGAGDTFLPFYSFSSKLKQDANLSLFLGSLSAAQSVESIGNSLSVDKNKMLKSIYHIVK